MRYRDMEKWSVSTFYWLVHVEVLEHVTCTKWSPVYKLIWKSNNMTLNKTVVLFEMLRSSARSDFIGREITEADNREHRTGGGRKEDSIHESFFWPPESTCRPIYLPPTERQTTRVSDFGQKTVYCTCNNAAWWVDIGEPLVKNSVWDPDPGS